MLTLGYPLASSGLQGGIALSQGLKKFQDDVGCPTKDPSGFPQAIKKRWVFFFESIKQNGSHDAVARGVWVNAIREKSLQSKHSVVEFHHLTFKLPRNLSNGWGNLLTHDL